MNWRCRLFDHDYGPEQEEPRRQAIVQEHQLTGGVHEYSVWEWPRFRACKRCGERYDVRSRFEPYDVPMDREDLHALRALVVATDLSNDHAFATLVRGLVNDMGMYAGDLGNALSVSRPTVMRWMDGKTSPHPAMREPVRTLALGMIDARLAKIDMASSKSP